MISNGMKRFCSDPIENIENYDKALADDTQVWACHHRLEITPSGNRSVEDLISSGLYYNRPCSELIFLPPSEHTRIHKVGNEYFLGRHHTEETKEKLRNIRMGTHHTEEAKRKIGDAVRGERNAWYGRRLPEKVYEAQARVPHSRPMLGKHHSDETKKILSEQMKGDNNPWFGQHWYTDGNVNVRGFECPEGFRPGRTTRKRSNGK